MRSTTASTFLTTRPRAKRFRGVRYARSHDCQRASRKPSAHAGALCLPCAHHVPPLYCPGATREGRGARYARTTVNAHRVRQTCMQPPCALLVRIMSPTVLPRRYARRPRRTQHSHDRQRTSRKLSVHAAALCSPCANYFPHYNAQAAAYATFERSSTRIK
jgi:hypothetical protein